MPRPKILLIVLALLLVFKSALTNAQVGFAALQSYPLNAAPYQALIADFDGDGKPDLAVLSVAGGTVSLLLNNGDGTFGSAVDFPAATNPFSDFPAFTFHPPVMGAADFNGDGNLDLFVANAGDPNTGADASAVVLIGNGNGAFQAPVTTPLDFNPGLVGVGKLNGDNRSDAMVSGHNKNCLMVPLLGNIDGTLTRGADIPLVPCPSPPDYLADFNGDNKLDTSIYSGSDMIMLLGTGDATFQTPFHTPIQAPQIFFLSSGDFDHDGKSDLLSSSYQSFYCEFNVCHPQGAAGSITLMLGKSDGTFGGPGVIASVDFGPPVVGDFDGDANLDFAAANFSFLQGYSGLFSFFQGDGRGGFTGPTILPFAAANIVTGDLDGDGFGDMVLIDSSSVQVALNTTPTFSLVASDPGPPIPAGGTATYTITVVQQHGSSSDPVAISCSAPVTEHIFCSVSPSSVVPGGTATMTVTTAGASAGLGFPVNWPRSRLFYALWLPTGAVFFCGVPPRSRRPKQWMSLLLGCVFGVGLFLQLACGGSRKPPVDNGTPAGTYTITIAASAGTIHSSTTVSLAVQ